jgi:hypothetical protein
MSFSSQASDCVLDLADYKEIQSGLGFRDGWIAQETTAAKRLNAFGKVLSEKNIRVSNNENSSESNITIEQKTLWGEFRNSNTIVIITPGQQISRNYKTRLDFQVQAGSPAANKGARQLIKAFERINTCD